MNRADPSSSEQSPRPRWYQGRSRQRTLQLAVVYVLLATGALFMLFPLIWMVSASLKPEWQVFTQPIIWIPQRWHQQEAGETGQLFNVWKLRQNGETLRVVKIGTTNYSTVLDVDGIEHIYSIPKVQVSDPNPEEMEGVGLNVRTAVIDGQERRVFALAQDGENLIVADVADFRDLKAVSKPALREAPEIAVEIGAVTLQAYRVPIDGVEQTVVPAGGDRSFATVVSVDAIRAAQLVRAERLRPLGTRTIGKHRAKVFELVEDGQTVQVIPLLEERCRPILDYAAAEQAVILNSRDLIGKPELRAFGSVELEVQEVAGGQGEAVLLARGTDTVLGIAPQEVHDVQIACAEELNGPRLAKFGSIYLPVKDDFRDPHGPVRSVALVGEWQQMFTVVPVAALQEAYDVPEGELRRLTTPSLHWENFINALSTKIGEANYLTFFGNTAVLVALNIAGSLLSCILVAYGFARLRAPGKTVLFVILLATMMLPFPVTMVPLYELFVRTGELTEQIGMFRIGQDTLWPLFLPAFFGNPFLIFLLRQFFMTIPRELEEAAVIDGANRAQVLWNIFLPLIKPALATTVVFTFMGVWNDFMGPLIYLDSPRNFTVTLGLRFFMGQFEADYHLLMAASLIALLPMLILFFLAQRFFIEGITMTGIKG